MSLLLASGANILGSDNFLIFQSFGAAAGWSLARNSKAQIEEIAFRKGWISEAALTALAQPMLKNGYGQYLMQMITELDYESH